MSAYTTLRVSRRRAEAAAIEHLMKADVDRLRRIATAAVVQMDDETLEEVLDEIGEPALFNYTISFSDEPDNNGIEDNLNV